MKKRADADPTGVTTPDKLLKNSQFQGQSQGQGQGQGRGQIMHDGMQQHVAEPPPVAAQKSTAAAGGCCKCIHTNPSAGPATLSTHQTKIRVHLETDQDNHACCAT